jgi:hypothetical protein
MQNTFIRQNWDVITLLIIALNACIYTAWYVTVHPAITVKYDCSIAEINPDYPIQVREACRRLRAENFKENLQKPK